MSLHRPYLLLLTPLLLTLGIGAFAADKNPVIGQKHLLPSAVRVQVTQRGMKYFDNRLSELLGNLGVNLDEGYFPAMTYGFDKTIKVEDYRDSNPEMVQLYSQVRELLTKWLVGFSLNDHKPAIEIGESGYIAEFSRFGLVTDEALMNTLGKRDGAVLAIELEVKKMTVSTTSVTAWDTNNEFLGKVGLEDVTVSAGTKEAPLKIRLPFYLRMNAAGGLDFEALELQHNLSQVPVALKYQKLITPTVTVEINGRKFQMNTAEVDRLLNEKTPLILDKIREHLGDFASKQLPELLNEKAKEFIGGKLEQIQDMIPPGQEKNDRRPNFKWGLMLQNLNLKKSLNIDLTAYVEDSLNTKSEPMSSRKSRGAPSLNLLPQDKFDIALSVDRALINRVLQLSFERKNFEIIKQSDGSVLKLMAPPAIDYVKIPAGASFKNNETFVKLRVTVENEPDSMFLKKTIVVSFDILAKIRQLKDKSGMQMVLQSIDTESLAIDEKYLSWVGAMFKGKVFNGIKNQLKTKSDKWKKKEEVIPGALPLPPEILGIKLDINRVAMDPNGHLVMYLDYAKTGAK